MENPQTRYGAVLANRMKKRAIPEKYSHKRSNSLVDVVESSQISCMTLQQQQLLLIQQQQMDWLPVEGDVTNLRNKLLVALEDQEHSADMLQAISDKRTNVVETWKKFTKMRQTDDQTQRRIENSSWRLWFKQRIEQERKRQSKLYQETSTLYSIFGQSSNSRPASRRNSKDLKRSLSAGNLLSLFDSNGVN